MFGDGDVHVVGCFLLCFGKWSAGLGSGVGWRCSGDGGVIKSGWDVPTLLGGCWLCHWFVADNYGLQAGCDIRYC